MKKWISSFLALSFLSVTTQLCAAPAAGLIDNLVCNSNGYWYVTLGAGASFYDVTQENNVNTGPGWPLDHYSPGNTNPGGVMTIGMGLAVKQSMPAALPLLSAGLSYTYGVSTETDGTVTQYSIPKFKNYNYEYKVARQTLLAVAKADLFSGQFGFGSNYLGCCQSLVPYVTGGAGVTWNRGSGYTESPLHHVTKRVSPGFGSETNRYFAWMIGAGLDFTMQQNFIISLEYQYTHLGYVETGKGEDYSNLTGFNYSNESLRNKVNANTILLSITGLTNLL